MLPLVTHPHRIRKCQNTILPYSKSAANTHLPENSPISAKTPSTCILITDRYRTTILFTCIVTITKFPVQPHLAVPSRRLPGTRHFLDNLHATPKACTHPHQQVISRHSARQSRTVPCCHATPAMHIIRTHLFLANPTSPGPAGLTISSTQSNLHSYIIPNNRLRPVEPSVPDKRAI